MEHGGRRTEKRLYATELLHRLRDRFGAGGFLHFGQGKWYPGEQLPRWALSVIWRSDGQPCWNDPSLFGDERKASSYAPGDALGLITALATRLGLDPQFVMPGYEDTWYYLWRERRLPINVDPFDSRLDDELERARLRRIFSQGLPSPSIRASDPARSSAARREPTWVTGRWFLRDSAHVPDPGDSPMGYRLPLDSLPWVSEADAAQVLERDPFAPRPALAEASLLRWQSAGAPARSESQPEPGRFESAAWITRSALCVEPRGGHLYVFLPPLAWLEDYLELLAAVEAAAAELGVRVVLEGLPAAARSAAEAVVDHTRSGRGRGEYPPGFRLERAGRPGRVPVRGCAPVTPFTREIHVGRPSHRHRGRQPLCSGRPDTGRQPAAAASGLASRAWSATGTTTGPVVPFFNAVHWPDQPGAADRRGSRRAMYELEIALEELRHRSTQGGAAPPGWSIACSVICWST